MSDAEKKPSGEKTGRDRGEEWWQTGIIEMMPGVIRLRGYEIQDLIGRVSFPAMIWLMLRGELPGDEEAALLEAALVASVDHGPHAPSIAISRMATSCGLPINGAMASARNASTRAASSAEPSLSRADRSAATALA